MNEQSEQKAPAVRKRQLPDELDAIDGMFRLQLMQRNAPASLLDKWDDFINAAADWTEAEAGKANA